MSYHINLNKITIEAYKQLNKLDETFIGTPNYLGIAYFWDLEYKHYLRDVTIQTRVKIHNELLKFDLNVGEVSPLHKEIITKYALKDKHYRKCFGLDD